MIDLGDELAGFGEEPKQPADEGMAWARANPSYGRGPDGMRTFGKLADLQKGGFNVNPDTGRGIGTPRQGFGDPRRGIGDPPKSSFTLPDPLTDDSGWTLVGKLVDDMELTIKTWMPDLTTDLDSLADSLNITFGTIDQMGASQDGNVYTISVPDQPFKWKPNMVTSRSFAFKCRHGIAAGTCRRCAK